VADGRVDDHGQAALQMGRPLELSPIDFVRETDHGLIGVNEGRYAFI
jgi:hypothetical protein